MFILVLLLFHIFFSSWCLLWHLLFMDEGDKYRQCLPVLAGKEFQCLGCIISCAFMRVLASADLLSLQIFQRFPTKSSDSNKIWCFAKVRSGGNLRGGRLAARLQLCTPTYSSSCLHSSVANRPAIVSTQLVYLWSGRRWGQWWRWLHRWW